MGDLKQAEALLHNLIESILRSQVCCDSWQFNFYQKRPDADAEILSQALAQANGPDDTYAALEPW